MHRRTSSRKEGGREGRREGGREGLPQDQVVGDEVDAYPEGGASLLVRGKGGGALNRLEEDGLDGQKDGHP